MDYRHPNLYHASQSPDRTKIVYYNYSNMFLVDLISRSLNVIDSNTLQTDDIVSVGDFYQVVWSPKGDKLAITTIEFRGDGRLFVLDLTSNELSFIPDRVEYNLEIAWAPDNIHLLTLSETDNVDARVIGSLFLINTISKEIEPISAIPEKTYVGGKGNLSWSPNGQYIAIRFADTSGIFGIYIINVVTQ